MLDKEQIDERVKNIINTLETKVNHKDYNFYTGMYPGLLEGLLTVLEYFPKGTCYPDIFSTSIHKYLFTSKIVRETYEEAMLRHAKNYLAGIPFRRNE